MTTAARALPALKYPGTAAAFIAVATSQVGYREGENNDTVFGAWYPMNHEAWCAMFMSWVAEQSGCRAIVPKHAYTPAGADWFQDRGQWSYTPHVGDIVYYDISGLGRISHTGTVTAVHEDGTWTACEGNTNDGGSREGNGVYLKRRSTVGTRGGFGRPKYVKVPVAAKPVWQPASMALRELNPAVKPDAKHLQVRLLQWCLHKAGYGQLTGECTTLYGPATKAAVDDFHERNPRFRAVGKRHDYSINAAGFRFLQKQAGLS